MAEVFFTSDTHFGHANVIRFCDRPFSSVEEMDEALIENWNNRVTNNDTVYILGDFIFRAKEAPEVYLKRLRGKKHLIIGNHDKDWMKKCDLQKYFKSVHELWNTSDGKRALTLFHRPMLSWPHENRVYMVHGHIHNNTQTDDWKFIWTKDRMLNAGVDINNYMPVTFEEMLDNNIQFKKEHLCIIKDFVAVGKWLKIVSVQNAWGQPLDSVNIAVKRVGLVGYLHCIIIGETFVMMCPQTEVGFIHSTAVTDYTFDVRNSTYKIQTRSASYILKEAPESEIPDVDYSNNVNVQN